MSSHISAIPLPTISAAHRPRHGGKNTNTKISPPSQLKLKQTKIPPPSQLKLKQTNAKRPPPSERSSGFGSKRPEQLWRCVEGCGACCKLAKGPSFATPEEIFTDPADIELYKSLIGTDGWCIHYDKGTRKCSIYNDRPYFCRVEEDVFLSLYAIPKKKFNNVACNSCRDTIKSVYGPHSQELDNFNANST